MPSFLSDEDVSVLRQLIRWWRGTRVVPYKKYVDKHKFQSPDTYIALPPVSGIPGLTETAGTGVDDSLGSATCTTYKINSSSNLEIYAGLTKVVYNLSREAIPRTFDGVNQNWITISRTKQGRWIAEPYRGFDRCTAVLKGAITSAGTGSVTFTVDDVIPIRGVSPVAGSSEELTVYNIHNFDADNNANARIEYNHSLGRWELYQVDCPN